MPTTSVSIGYRPVRIGFLIRDSSIEDFVKCCEINTLLWGGIYNPIIPVGSNDYLVQQFIKLFSVDILFPVIQDTKLQSVIAKYPHLKNPHHISEGISYEDWHTKKQEIAYIDVIHLIDYYWNEEFKHNKDERSNCAYVSWDSKEPLSHLFSAIFGAYPKDMNLKVDYVKAFKNGLRAGDIVIKDNLEAELSKRIDPIRLTASRLTSYRNLGREDGLYIGSQKNFWDLVLFWNLRAAGTQLVFLPIDEANRFEQYISTFINILDERPSRHPNFEDWIGIYCLNGKKDDHKTILSKFKPKKKFMFSYLSDTIWNGMNINPYLPEFKSKSTMSLIEQQYGRYNVSIPLPESPFSEDRQHMQNYVISLNLLTEFGYPGYTLKLPNLPDLNEFYGRQVTLEPWNLRIGRNNFGLIQHYDKDSITVHPIQISDLMIKIFERAGIKATLSAPGRLADLIIKNMDDIESCRVFKIRGVRKLLKEMGRRIGWIEAGKLIWREDFRKFQDLYIESRKKRSLSPTDVIHFLIKKKVISPTPHKIYKILSKFKRKEFSCANCGYKSLIPNLDFEYAWKCPFCGFEHCLPLYIRNKLRNELCNWHLKKVGLFAKENNQEGSVPVILSLMQLNRLIGHGHDAKWITSLDLKNGDTSCEIDFAMLNLGQRFDEQELQIAIGECKEKDEINDRDIENLCAVKEKLEKSEIDCYLVFSKTTDTFLPAEIERFKKLLKEREIAPILFTNTELEPYEPYWDHPKVNTLPHKYALSFQEIAENSRHIYLE